MARIPTLVNQHQYYSSLIIEPGSPLENLLDSLALYNFIVEELDDGRYRGVAILDPEANRYSVISEEYWRLGFNLLKESGFRFRACYLDSAEKIYLYDNTCDGFRVSENAYYLYRLLENS
jgi:hypothetical protein